MSVIPHPLHFMIVVFLSTLSTFMSEPQQGHEIFSLDSSKFSIELFVESKSGLEPMA